MVKNLDSEARLRQFSAKYKQDLGITVIAEAENELSRDLSTKRDRL
jgi:hypothetical protein